MLPFNLLQHQRMIADYHAHSGVANKWLALVCPGEVANAWIGVDGAHEIDVAAFANGIGENFATQFEAHSGLVCVLNFWEVILVERSEKFVSDK